MSKGVGADLQDLTVPSITEADQAQIDVIGSELETQAGLTKYWHHIRQYTEAAEWEGEFPKGWDDFGRDLAIYIYEVEFRPTEPNNE